MKFRKNIGYRHCQPGLWTGEEHAVPRGADELHGLQPEELPDIPPEGGAPAAVLAAAAAQRGEAHARVPVQGYVFFGTPS